MSNFYNDVLIDHNLHPQHKNKQLKQRTTSIGAINSSCGDKFVLDYIVKDGKIVDASFSGVGCAISQASADLMLSVLIGKSLTEAEDYASKLFKLIRTGEISPELGDVNALQDIAAMPSRVACAELAWTSVEKLIAIVGVER